MHVRGDPHDTPNRLLHTAPAGLGVRCAVQRVPFQRSANTSSVPNLSSYPPTAVHAVVLAHESAARVPLGMTGFTVGSTRHVLPAAGRPCRDSGAHGPGKASDALRRVPHRLRRAAHGPKRVPHGPRRSFDGPRRAVVLRAPGSGPGGRCIRAGPEYPPSPWSPPGLGLTACPLAPTPGANPAIRVATTGKTLSQMVVRRVRRAATRDVLIPPETPGARQWLAIPSQCSTRPCCCWLSAQDNSVEPSPL